MNSHEIDAKLEGLPIDEFFEKSFKKLVLRDPQLVTRLRMAKELGMRNDTLKNLSDTYIRETHALEKKILTLLRKYNPEELTPEQKLSYQVYEWFLDDLVRGHKFMYHNYPVHHFLGSYDEDLKQLFIELHIVNTKEDAQDYVSRLSLVYTQIEQLLEGLKIREEKGIIPPNFIIEMTRNKIKRFLHTDSSDSSIDAIDETLLVLYTSFEEKLKNVSMPPKEKQKLLKEAQTQIKTSVIPGFLKLLEYLKYLEPLATDAAGVWKFPEGDEYYIYALRKETSTDLTPDEIHAIGLQEVERIQKEMRTIFDSMGYPDTEPVNALIMRTTEEGGYIDTTTPKGKDTVIKTYEKILDDVAHKLETVCDLHPKTELVVYGDMDFGGGGGYFVSGATDGSRPAMFHTGVGGSKVPVFRMPAIAYHEAIPGHYFQVSIAKELDLPRFRNEIPFTAYIEGWGMYAEFLAYELGVYNNNPHGNIGRLLLELLRAVRLVVDTGIHSKKWTREKAQEYMKDIMGNGGAFHEVDRFIVLPAQAVGYKIGMLKILELREKAQNALKDTFDIKEFHRVILGNGGMPLDILEQIVDEYIDETLHSKG
ncbi:MAG: DUF885 domain-containing protein [Candidatus Methanofastidiosia archaeon]|jgi:uncharacterized protein (DUF885 family)